MKRSEKAEIIGQMLDELYPTTPVPLDHTSAYTLLVAVMLSAQTKAVYSPRESPAVIVADSKGIGSRSLRSSNAARLVTRIPG